MKNTNMENRRSPEAPPTMDGKVPLLEQPHLYSVNRLP